MARTARVVCPGLPHQVTQWGNNKQAVFFEPADFEFYLRLLRRALPASDSKLLAYVLHENHLHLIVVPGRSDSLAELGRRVNSSYTAYVNSKQGRSGHLWQSRSISCLLSEPQTRKSIRFVENGPAQIRPVKGATQYPVSSAPAHLTGTDTARVLDMDYWQRQGGALGWRKLLSERSEVQFGGSCNGWTVERNLRSGMERDQTAVPACPGPFLYKRILYAGV